MSIYLIVSIVIGHFVGDWICQSREMAEKKIENLWILLLHVLTANSVLFVFVLASTQFFSIENNVVFCAIVFCVLLSVLHFIQDLVLWSIYHDARGLSYNDHKQDKIFFNTIALDQIIHLSITMIIANWLF